MVDFVSDALSDRRRLRALTVVDALTREAPAIDDTVESSASMSSGRAKAAVALMDFERQAQVA